MRTIIVAAALASQLAAQPTDSVTPAQRARDVVMRHMNAIGGIDAYSAVQSTHMVILMRMPVAGLTMRTEFWMTKPNLSYMHARTELTSTEAGFDGMTYWTLDEDEGVKIYTRRPDLLNAAVYDPFEALARYDVTWVGVRDRGGRKMDALQMIAGDGQLYTQYFDVATGLFSRLDVGSPSSPASTMRFEKYKKFGSLLYATVVTTKVADSHEAVARVLSVDHKPIDRKRYELPDAVRAVVARQP